MTHLKNIAEIDQLRRSADLVGRTLAAVGSQIKPGVSTAGLDEIAETFIRDHDAVPAFKGYRVGNEVYPATLCTSVNDEVVHGIPGPRTLVEGDLVSVDCGVILDGFYGDSAFTFAVGQISPENASLCHTTHQALLAGIESAVAGNRLGDIGWAVQSRCEREGYGVVRALVGHGIGRNLHEDPQVPNYGRRGFGRKLRPGLVICIEPMVNRGAADVETDPDARTVRTSDQMTSAHYEHMVALMPGGGTEVLTSFSHIEQALEVLPYHLTESVSHG